MQTHNDSYPTPVERVAKRMEKAMAKHEIDDPASWNPFTGKYDRKLTIQPTPNRACIGGCDTRVDDVPDAWCGKRECAFNAERARIERIIEGFRMTTSKAGVELSHECDVALVDPLLAAIRGGDDA